VRDVSTKTENAVDERLVKALTHPLRWRILEVLNQGVSSPREIAEELDAKLGDVGYHVRRLHELGVIELVRTEQRRGAIKHFYKANSRAMLDNEHWARLPQSARRQLFGQTLDQIWSHVRHAIKHNGFDRDDTHVSHTTFDLDAQGYADMVALVDETLTRALGIQAEVMGRRAEGADDGDSVKTELVQLHFLPDGERR
jgi:DNA-binding MarR family transcriptional regulator